MRRLHLYLLFAFVLKSYSFAAFAEVRTIAILGDSLSTGAGVHPALTFDSLVLWDAFNGKVNLDPDRDTLARLGFSPATSSEYRSGVAKPLVLWPSPRDFDGSGGTVFRHALMGLSRLYLNTEEYSWGYLFGIKQGVAADNVWIAAENGARQRNMTRQYDRVLTKSEGRRPSDIFIFFSGNDLCAPTIDFATTPEDFAAELKNGIEYIARNGSGESRIFVIGFLNVVQILYSEAIENQKVQAFGGEATCKELRERDYKPEKPQELPPEAGFFSYLMPPSPLAMCPTLFGKGTEFVERQGQLANRIRAFRDKQREVVSLLAGTDGDLTLRYLNSPSELTFDGQDIAADCFHLSLSGQARIAEAVHQAVSD